MKKLIIVSICTLLTTIFYAQVRLDVEGDAKITGKMDMIKEVGDSSLFIGANAGINDNPFTTNRNTFIGTNAGKSNIGGYRNTFVGYNAGLGNTNGIENSFYGYHAGLTNSTGIRNSFFGESAGESNTTGNSNAFFGKDAGEYNTTGGANAFFGEGAGEFNTTGEYNAFFGSRAGADNRGGEDNAFFGYRAGLNITNGDDNTFLGASAGFGLSKGNGNTFIGRGTGRLLTTTDSLERAIAIGYNARVGCHNCASIGGLGEYAVNVGIGENEPTDRLHIYEAGKASIRLNTTLSGITSLKLYEFNNFGFEIMNSGATNHLFFHAFSNGTLTPMARWSRNGYFINYGSADIKGNIYHNGSLIHSDKRYKKQIKTIDNPLAQLHRINGVSYAYQTQKFEARNFDEQRTFGVIAQEVEKVFPELVHENEEGYKAVNYDGLIPVLIEATKEQQQLIDEQKEQLSEQQKQINELKGVVEKLLAASAVPKKTNTYTLPLLQKASLGQNRPNPFNSSTLIDYFLPENIQKASIQVTSLDGKILGQVQILEKGQGQVNIQVHTYPAGTYYYSLIMDGQVVETKKMVLTK